MVAIKAATVREAVREAVHMPGEVRARSVSGRDGAIVFDGGAGGNVRVSGLADASAGVGAARGGRIDVTGTSVLLQGATLERAAPSRAGWFGWAARSRAVARRPIPTRRRPAHSSAGMRPGRWRMHRRPRSNAASRIDVSATGAQGSGGTAIVWSDHSTRADGEIAATGAVSAGAVEVSAGSRVQSVALRRIRLGRGGQLLLDPRNIEIGSGSGPEAGDDLPGGSRHRSTLAAGTDVSLLASNDIGWFDAFTQITPAAGARAGNLRLAAGRSVTLSGTFNTGLGDWTIVANERAANGVDPSLREAGGATIDLGNAQFINSNGKLTLTLADGAGAGNGGGLADGSAGGVDRIRIGHFSGDSLAAQVAPGAVHADGDRVQVQFFGNVNAANAITIDGDILNAVSELTLSGSSVNWTAEKTGGRLTGEMGSIRFVENGVTTRFGRAGTDDATRLNLSGPAGLSRVYGDADPGQAALGGQALALAAHNAQAPADDLSQVLAPGSLAVTGPGVAAGVGNHILQIGAGASIALKPLEYDADFNVVGGATGAYFIDLTPATAGLGITPRPLTAAVLNPGYTYGSPAAAATLSGVVNGDAVGLTASIGGASVTLAPLAGGLGFAPRLGAGSHGYTLTGLAGAGSANYTLDLGGVPAGTVTVAPKPITYAGGSAQQTYGTATYSPALQGVLPGDDVMPGGQSITTITAGTAGGSNALPVGSYDIGLTGLAGADQSNYVLAAGGHTPLRLTITPRPLTWQVAADIDSTYGTLASGMAATLYGLLADDLVSPLFVASGLPIGARTPAGYHPLAVGGLAGTGSGNYQLAATGNTAALLRVAPKPLTFGGSDSTQVYGLNTVAAPVLQGVEAGDQVTPVVAIVGGSTSTGQGESGVLSVGHYITSVSALAGSDAGNYTLAATGNVNPTTAITPRPLTFELAGGSSATTYGTAAALPALMLWGLVPGDVIGGTIAAFQGASASAIGERTPAGSYTWGVAALTGTGAGNYTLAASGHTAGSLVIAKKPITWQVAAGSAVYGDVLSNTTQLDGVLAGDFVLPQLSAWTAGGTLDSRPSVGSAYTARVSGLAGAAAGNYELQADGNLAGNLFITPRPVTFQVANAASVYGTLATPGAVTLHNLVAGDHPIPTLAFGAGGSDVALGARTPAGTYQQRVATLDSANYAVTGGTPGTLTIARKPVSVTVPDASSVYGTPAVLGGGTVSGLLAGDDAGAGPTTFRGSAVPWERLDAGDYPGQLQAGLVGADAGNYTITQGHWGSLRVSPKPVTYSIELRNWSQLLGPDAVLTYGGLYAANLRVGANLDGVLPDDSNWVAMGLNAPSIRVSSADLIAVGDYAWSGSALGGSRAGNYVLAPAGHSNARLRIEPRPLPIVLKANHAWGMPDDPQYGMTNAYTLATEFFPVSTRDQVSASAALVTPDGPLGSLPARLPVGTYPIVMAGPLTGADAANYVAQPVAGALTVRPRQIGYTIADTTSVYGQQGTPAAASLFGVLPGDVVAPAGLSIVRNGAPTALTARSPAGTYRVELNALTGADSRNYEVTLLGGNWGESDWIVSRPGSHRVDTAPLSVVYGPLAITYGDLVAAPGLSGTLFDDEVGLRLFADGSIPYQYDVLDGRRLDAGSYRLRPQLSGAGASNYHLANGTAQLSVARKPLASGVDRSAVYGNLLAAPQLAGQLPGDHVVLRIDYFRDGTDQPITYSERTGAGRYRQQASLYGTQAPNYELPLPTTYLTIAPRPLAFLSAAAGSMVYGSSAQVGELAGLLFGDAVHPVGTLSGASLPSAGLGSDPSGKAVYAGRAGAGTHPYALHVTGLAGTAAGNYSLPPVTSGGMLTVAPKPITWRVADTSFTYGGLKNCEPGGNCLAWAPLDGPPAYGQVLFDGVLAGDDITGAQALIDQIGRQGVISAGLPAGPYYQVVTGLGGGSSPNYVIASAGNTPGVLTVKPQWLSYTVSHGAYLPEIGVIGDPGKVTALLGWKPGSSGGVPVQADVQGVMVTRDLWDRIVRDPSQLGLGRYTLRVETLAGSDASNYRIVQPDDRFRDASSTAGVFQVFGNSSLGMNLASALAPPQPVAVPTSAGAPASSSSAPAPAVEAPTDTAFSARTGLGFDFGRYDNVSGTDGHVTISSAAGRAQAVTETSTEVGGVELSAQAGSAAEALATFGVRGVSARAEAGAHVDAQLASGPGFASVGAQANAEVELSANRSGVKAGAEAAVGASAQGGAAGDIGIGEGSADATASVFAYARSDNEWTFKDGRLTTKAEQKIGVGASAGTSVGFESGPGKVDAGIIVYSPGSLGGSFDFSGGYSDGTLSLSIDLGAQIGLLGAGISLDFSLDLDAIGDDLHSAARTVGEAFMSGIFGIDFSETPSQESIVWNAFKGALDVKDKDPVTRLRYLKEKPGLARVQTGRRHRTGDGEISHGQPGARL